MPTPKIVLITTATMATPTVSRRAWTMSGSSRIPRRSSKPSVKVFLTTSDSGQATRKNR